VVFPSNVTGSLTQERVRDRMRTADDERAAERGIAGALANVALFSQCSKRELRLVAKLAKTKSVRESTSLTLEGEHGDTMFVILTGHATVHKGGRKLAELGPGDVVGELAILSKAPRNATVTTTRETDVATISRRDVHRLIADAPGFSRKLLEALATRVRDLDRKIVC
jgi:CRP/FNR family transcriptional regulator, cyclic AMP receptor protein